MQLIQRQVSKRMHGRYFDLNMYLAEMPTHFEGLHVLHPMTLVFSNRMLDLTSASREQTTKSLGLTQVCKPLGLTPVPGRSGCLRPGCWSIEVAD